MKLLELKHVYAGYDDEIVLKDVNLVVYDNDFIGVIGPNGGGKTTLAKLILGLIKPLKGKVETYFPGEQQRGQIGYLPQKSEIDARFPISVFEVVLSGLMSKKDKSFKYSREDRQKATNLLKQMGIYKLRRKTIGELSGGQMQRVFLCRALISSPRLLILDEPDTFVDNQFEGELYETLRQLNEKMAIIIVSHDLGTISYYVKSIACVNQSLFYHQSNIITEKQLKAYNCPIQLITHGNVPHQVLKKH